MKTTTTNNSGLAFEFTSTNDAQIAAIDRVLSKL
jgi:hypothetical protein